MILELVTLAAYLITVFLFHWGMAVLATSLSEPAAVPLRKRYVLIPAVINSGLFLLCNFMQFRLMTNWLVALPALYLELRYLMKVRRWLALGMALETVICGLSAMLFYRSVLAILLHKPLYAFDNFLRTEDPWASVPVVLGFLSCYFIFRRYAGERQLRSLRHLLSGKHQVRFLAACMVLTLLFLSMQAFLYDSRSSTADDLHVKLWSLISCIYISLGYLFAMRYALRVSVLYYMSDRNTAMQQDLDRRAVEEEALLETLEVDELTGVLTRQTGQTRITELMQRGQRFCLCMVDLDGLKYVNDNLGHREGDVYLRTAAEVLRDSCRHGRDIVCRFGGDEFLLAFVGAAPADADKRMGAVAEALRLRAQETGFPMAFSYGVVAWEGEEPFQSLLDRADQTMYVMKKQHKAAAPDRVR